MRNPVDVFTTVYNLFPKEYLTTENDKLFNWYINDAAYKAPELWPEVYTYFHGFLLGVLPMKTIVEKQENWMISVMSAFSTIPEEEIKKQLQEM